MNRIEVVIGFCIGMWQLGINGVVSDRHDPICLEAEARAGMNRSQTLRSRGETPVDLCKTECMRLALYERGAAKEIVGRLRNEECKELLDQVFWIVRDRAARGERTAQCILQRDPATAVSVARELDQGCYNELVLDAAKVLCRSGGRDCGDVIKGILPSTKSEPNQALVEALRIGERETAPLSSTETLRRLDDIDPGIGAAMMKQLTCQDMSNSEIRASVVKRASEYVMFADPGLDGPSMEAARERSASAIGVVGRCKIEEASDDLIVLLQDLQEYDLEDGNTSVVLRAIGALGGKGAKDAVAGFVLKHRQHPMRGLIRTDRMSALEVAVRVLGDIGDRSSAAALRHALNDATIEVRLAAMDGIYKLDLVCDLREELMESQRRAEGEFEKGALGALLRKGSCEES